MDVKLNNNPAIPRRNDLNYADCASCDNKQAAPVGQYCTEYQEEPAFDCKKHTARIMLLKRDNQPSTKSGDT